MIMAGHPGAARGGLEESGLEYTEIKHVMVELPH
jgi:hypothetical protein